MTTNQAYIKLNEIIKMAKTDPERALIECNKLISQLEQDQCQDLQYISGNSSNNSNIGLDALGWMSGMTPMRKLFEIFS